MFKDLLHYINCLTCKNRIDLLLKMLKKRFIQTPVYTHSHLHTFFDLSHRLSGIWDKDLGFSVPKDGLSYVCLKDTSCI